VKLLGEWKIPIGWGLKLLKINIPLNLMRHIKTAGRISRGSFRYNIKNTIGGKGSGSGPQDWE